MTLRLWLVCRPGRFGASANSRRVPETVLDQLRAARSRPGEALPEARIKALPQTQPKEPWPEDLDEGHEHEGHGEDGHHGGAAVDQAVGEGGQVSEALRRRG